MLICLHSDFVTFSYVFWWFFMICSGFVPVVWIAVWIDQSFCYCYYYGTDSFFLLLSNTLFAVCTNSHRTPVARWTSHFILWKNKNCRVLSIRVSSLESRAVSGSSHMLSIFPPWASKASQKHGLKPCWTMPTTPEVIQTILFLNICFKARSLPKRSSLGLPSRNQNSWPTQPRGWKSSRSSIDRPSSGSANVSSRLGASQQALLFAEWSLAVRGVEAPNMS